MATTDPLIGKQLGDYVIKELLGQGGMARVYRGYDERLERYAAVKIIDALLTASENEAEYRDRFRREARAIARLKHPNIVNIYQFGEFGSTYYMAMEYIEGDDLRQEIKEYTKKKQILPQDRMMRVMRDMAQALDYAHKEGVIHRDVKPSNIMVTPAGQSILMDFGLALSVPEGTIGSTFGSVHYIAPEQAVSSARAVPQSDLYSLGVVLYEMLTGRVPFDDQSTMSVALKHLSEAPPSPSTLNPTITPEVEELVLKALDKEPRKRYPTGQALVEALAEALQLTDDNSNQSLGSRPSRSKPSALSSMSASGSVIAKTPPAKPTPKPGQASPDTFLFADTNKIAKVDMDDSPTITEGRKLRAMTRPLPSEDEPRRKLPLPLIVGGITILMVAVIAVIFMMIAPSANSTDGQATSQTTSAIVENPTESARTDDTENVADSTAAPIDEPSEVPTAGTPSVATNLENPDAQVLLYYDERTLILKNRDNTAINISDLYFLRTDTEGREYTFEASDWGNEGSQRALRRENCFQLWTSNFSNLANDESICTARQGWRQLRSNFWFWISDEEDAVFEVRRGSETIATCPTSPSQRTATYEYQCAVDISTSE